MKAVDRAILLRFFSTIAQQMNPRLFFRDSDERLVAQAYFRNSGPERDSAAATGPGIGDCRNLYGP